MPSSLPARIRFCRGNETPFSTYPPHRFAPAVTAEAEPGRRASPAPDADRDGGRRCRAPSIASQLVRWLVCYFGEGSKAQVVGRD
jgi:hypothetical protein